MNEISSKYEGYLHRYEAFRVTRDSVGPQASHAELLGPEKGEGALVLTEEGKERMMEDREEYSVSLRIREITQKAQEAAKETEDDPQDMAKAMAVFRRLCKGDIVPPYDEQKLREFSSELYQVGKMLQAQAQVEKRKRHRSLYGDGDGGEGSSSALLLPSVNAAEEMEDFKEAQAESVVEIPTDGVDLSSITSFESLGNGLVGASFDERM